MTLSMLWPHSELSLSPSRLNGKNLKLIQFIGGNDADAQKARCSKYFDRKDNFRVTVYPDIDYAFIVALIVILDGIHHEDDG
ncbi:Protein LURP-one-related 15 [Morella rubra]|uniref:Protein LURP-one-related 15 n=1 Tax=Morella rubra TaxID=262757 RepID=A0A6A1WGW9_9ROSI|nr:Protein LURP-one-related 15 [Morella rubra]